MNSNYHKVYGTGKVNIMCLYWVGEFRGRDFTVEDVYRLYKSVLKHIDRDFEFYVLTNDMEAVLPGHKIALKHADDWPGWWAKMELHRGDLPQGRTLYLDLDSHCIRSLGPILDTPGNLVMFPTPHPGATRMTELGWVIPKYQAATMLFDSGVFEWMYDKFKADWDYYITHYRSDQDIMAEWIPDQGLFFPQWMMKLGQVMKGSKYNITPPEDVIIITGQPKGKLFRQTNKLRWLEKMAR